MERNTQSYFLDVGIGTFLGITLIENAHFEDCDSLTFGEHSICGLVAFEMLTHLAAIK